ncbi:unnamed protein product [Sympodiomycopsis kandeliae]
MEQTASIAAQSGSNDFHAEMSKLITNIVSNSPIYAHLFSDSLILDTKASEPGYLKWELKLQPQHLNSRNVLHGAVSAALLDLISGPVIASLSKEDVQTAKRGVSTDMNLQYLNAVPHKPEEGVLVVGKCKKLGGKLAWIGMEIKTCGSDGTEGKVCVTGSHTKYVG